MGEWRETSLGEVVSSNNSSITSDYSHEKILYLDTGSITRGHIDGFQEIDLSEAPSRAKRLVQENVLYIQRLDLFKGTMALSPIHQKI